MEQFGHPVLYPHPIGTALGRTLHLCLGVKQHACAQTHATIVALKDVIIDTSLASLPELLVSSELGECHRFITHIGIEFHDWQRRGDRENLSKRESKSRKLESLSLDTCCQPQSSELRIPSSLCY